MINITQNCKILKEKEITINLKAYLEKLQNKKSRKFTKYFMIS